jgi:hypothetical protein
MRRSSAGVDVIERGAAALHCRLVGRRGRAPIFERLYHRGSPAARAFDSATFDLKMSCSLGAGRRSASIRKVGCVRRALIDRCVTIRVGYALGTCSGAASAWLELDARARSTRAHAWGDRRASSSLRSHRETPQGNVRGRSRRAHSLAAARAPRQSAHGQSLGRGAARRTHSAWGRRNPRAKQRAPRPPDVLTRVP